MLAQFSRLPPVSYGCAKYLRCSRRTLAHYVEQCGTLFHSLACCRLGLSFCLYLWKSRRIRCLGVPEGVSRGFFGVFASIHLPSPAPLLAAIGNWDGIKACVTASKFEQSVTAETYTHELAGGNGLVAARLVVASAEALHLHALQPERGDAATEPRPLTPPADAARSAAHCASPRADCSHRAPAANTRRRRRRPSPTPSARRRQKAPATGLTAERATGSPPRETPAASSALTARPRRSGKEQ